MIDQFNEHNKVFYDMQNDDNLQNNIIRVIDLLLHTFKNGNKVLICGNGGSAADSQHFATELVSKFKKDRKALNAEALTTDTSCLTAIGNDYSFNRVFARQVEAKGNKGDVLIGITTSGNSKNITKAFKQARIQDMITIAMTGNFENMKCEKYADYMLKIPSRDTARIQEGHVFLYHLICDYIEQRMES